MAIPSALPLALDLQIGAAPPPAFPPDRAWLGLGLDGSVVAYVPSVPGYEAEARLVAELVRVWHALPAAAPAIAGGAPVRSIAPVNPWAQLLLAYTFREWVVTLPPTWGNYVPHSDYEARLKLVRRAWDALGTGLYRNREWERYTRALTQYLDGGCGACQVACAPRLEMGAPATCPIRPFLWIWSFQMVVRYSRAAATGDSDPT